MKTTDEKLDDLISRFDVHLERDADWMKEDKEWKDKAQPAIDAFNGLALSWKLAIGFFAGIGVIFGAIFYGSKVFLGKP